MLLSSCAGMARHACPPRARPQRGGHHSCGGIALRALCALIAVAVALPPPPQQGSPTAAAATSAAASTSEAGSTASITATTTAASAAAAAAAAATAALDDSVDDDYIWGYVQSPSGEKGPKVRVAIPHTAKAWGTQLIAAQSQSESGLLRQALSTYTSVLRKYNMPASDEFRVRVSIGHLMMNMSLFGDAEASFDAASTLGVKPHVSHFWKGVAATKQGKLGDAVTAYETSLFFAPAFFPAMHHLGGLLIVQDRIDEGVHYLRAALDKMEALEGRANSSAVDVNSVLPRMVRHVLACFTATPASARDHALMATLDSFLSRWHSLDLGLLHEHLGFALQNVGAMDQAVAHLQRSWEAQPEETWIGLYTMLSLPLVYGSNAELEATWADLEDDVDAALQERLGVLRPERFRDMYSSTFLFPFAGRVTPAFAVHVADLFARARPPVRVVAPQLAQHYALGGAAREGAVAYTGGMRASIAREVAVDGWGVPFVTSVSGDGDDGGDEADRSVNLNDPPSRRRKTRRMAGTALSGSGGFDRAAREAATTRGVTAGADASRGGGGGDSFHRGSAGEVVRVGFLSYQLYEHTVGNLVRTLTAALSEDHGGVGGDDHDGAAAAGGAASSALPPEPAYVRPTFRTTVFLPRPVGDDVTQAILAHSDRLIKLESSPRNITTWRQQIADEAVDVLVTLHDGLDSYINTLLQARVAPVQVLFWRRGMSHAITQGLGDSIDFFVTGDDVAPGDVQSRYAEQVVRLGGLGTYVTAPLRPPRSHTFNVVQAYSLMDSQHLYLVPVSLLHMHPDFDAVLCGVLRGDPAALVMVLYESEQELWLERMRGRVRAALRRGVGIGIGASAASSDGGGGDRGGGGGGGGGARDNPDEVVTRLRFARMMPQDDLLSLMTVADVVLDPFPVGMGLPAVEALAMGTPVVTAPSAQPDRRFAAAVLRAVGTPDLIADSAEDLAAKAVSLSANTARRVELREHLRERVPAVVDWELAASSYVEAADAPELVLEPERVARDWRALIGRAGLPWARRRRVVAELLTDGRAPDGAGRGGAAGAAAGTPPSEGGGSRGRKKVKRKRRRGGA